MHSFVRTIYREDGIFFFCNTHLQIAQLQCKYCQILRQLLSNQPGCAALNLTLRF
jgi:hypothetical protein